MPFLIRLGLTTYLLQHSNDQLFRPDFFQIFFRHAVKVISALFPFVTDAKEQKG